MAASHAHAHSHSMTGRKLRTAFVLTSVILIVELLGGIFSHSLALLSDAGHVMTDIVALGLAWFATAQAERPPNERRTYGYHRTGILAALANSITLIMIVVAIAYEAFARLEHTEEVTPWLMFVSAAVGIAVNLYIGFGLREESADNLNLRAATLHVFSDVAASVAVVVGGAVILFTGWYPADPIISLVIALLIAKGAWDILRETLEILMESTPRGLNVAQLVGDMEKTPGVSDVHDLHIWSIAGALRVLSAHVQVEGNPQMSRCDALLNDLNNLLREEYSIAHTTIQFECAGCDDADLYCTMSQDEDHSHNHTEHAPVTTSAHIGDK